jgi:hypothetical protein
MKGRWRDGGWGDGERNQKGSGVKKLFDIAFKVIRIIL